MVRIDAWNNAINIFFLKNRAGDSLKIQTKYRSSTLK